MGKLDKLPKDAKLVFNGQIFDVYQWEQALYNGKKKIFERLVRPDTAQVIAVVGDKILIQEEEQPHMPASISLPGGRFEDGEEPREAALRELSEETGYASNDLVLWKSFQPQSKILFWVYIYVARNCRKVGDPKLDGGEKITSSLVTFEEFLSLADDSKLDQIELGYFLLRMRTHPDEQSAFKNLLWPQK